jgi:cytidylate kinase
MVGVVVGIVGKIRSGKSSLSRSLADELKWPFVSFGDQVRSVAHQRGLDNSREVLQEVGENLVETEPRKFCEAVLAQADWQPGQSLIVDGIRHLKIVEILRDFVRPSVLRLIYVKTADDVRESRLATEICGRQDLERIEHHSTEEQVGTILPGLVDLTVDGEKPLGNLISEVRVLLGENT